MNEKEILILFTQKKYATFYNPNSTSKPLWIYRDSGVYTKKNTEIK
jgi:hypothetical protein